jgi:uncharacterized membrane protein HdeD (DUF308 family)
VPYCNGDFMRHLFPTRERHAEILNSNLGYFLTCGIGLLSVGIATIAYSLSTPFIFQVSPHFLGMLLVAASLFIFLDTFQFWLGLWAMFIIYLGLGLTYLIIGIVFILDPPLLFLNSALIFFFIFLGIPRIIYSVVSPFPNSGVWFYNAAVNLVSAAVLFLQWLPADLFVFGFFIGLDLIFAGGIRIVNAMALARIPKIP